MIPQKLACESDDSQTLQMAFQNYHSQGGVIFVVETSTLASPIVVVVSQNFVMLRIWGLKGSKCVSSLLCLCLNLMLLELCECRSKYAEPKS